MAAGIVSIWLIDFSFSSKISD